MPWSGGGVTSRASAEEIARVGILVRIPPALRSYTGGEDEVVLEASDLAGLLRALEASFPGIRDRVVDETGRRRPYVNVFLNEDLVMTPFADVPLKPGVVVHILPSVAGG
jgi:molybdopterin synthase sulfur carrier subunit